MMAATEAHATAAKVYDGLLERRSPFLRSAWDASALTIPSLFPRRGEDGMPWQSHHENLATPFQSIGARGANNISSKLLLSIMPTSPFFRLQADKHRLDRLREAAEEDQSGAGKQAVSEVEESLAEMERRVMQEVDKLALRVPTFEALKHLVVTGNALSYLPDEGKMRIFHLDQFVVERDPMGVVMQIVTLDQFSLVTAPQPVLDAVLAPGSPLPVGGDAGKFIRVYTWVRREIGHSGWRVTQELQNGTVIAGTDHTWSDEDMPYMPLRLSHISGEDYGRGLVEQYEGDLRTLEAVTESLTEGIAASVRLLIMVDPNGTTRKKDIANAPNGAVVDGTDEEVSALTLDKSPELRVALDWLRDLEGRVSAAFLLNSSVIRQSERTTAEEVRFVAQELEDTLGGVYTVLTQDFQMPLISRLLARLKKRKALPALPKGLVTPTVVTGVEALGRGHDLQRMDVAFGTIQRFYGPEIAAEWTHPGEAIARTFTAAGVEKKGLVVTPEDHARMMEEKSAQALGEQMAPEVIRAQSQGQAQPPAQ